MRSTKLLLCTVAVCLAVALPAAAFLEDLCLPRRAADGTLSWCVRPDCPPSFPPNRACPAQTLDFATIKPGRSMIHMDSTYFIAQALGFRADVAYWIAAYQKTLANLRAWAMLPTRDPGLLCTVGLTSGEGCLTGATISGAVPLIMRSARGIPLNIPAGPKVLNYTAGQNGQPAQIVYYQALESWLSDPARTTGTLYKSPVPQPVPLQIARFGLYLHTLQDSSSHATYCGDDAPTRRAAPTPARTCT